MFNWIWAGMILFSIILSFINGSAEAVAAAASAGAGDAVQMSLELVGITAFWSGIMNIAQKSGVVDIAATKMKPLFKLLFKNTSPESEEGGYMLLNITANILGLGNAATPFGLKAMKEMNKSGGDTATDDMVMFLVLNTASIQLIPTTVISMRAAAGSAAPSDIIMSVWIVSAAALAVGIAAARWLK